MVFQQFSNKFKAFVKRKENGTIMAVKKIKPRVPFKNIPIKNSKRVMANRTGTMRKGLKKRL